MYLKLVYELFKAGINAVHPSKVLQKHLYVSDEHLVLGDFKVEISHLNKLIVIAAGKAAAAMSKVSEDQIGNFISQGIYITKYDHQIPLSKFYTLEAGHPVPDNNSVLAVEKVLRLLQQLEKNDIVLLLLSGGASSLLTDVPPGISLKEIQHLSSLLVNSKAGVHEINSVRKHLSLIKGGNLVKVAYPASIVTLIISDVIGDDPGIIASGPTAPDNTTFSDACEVLEKYNIWNQVSENVKQYLQKGISGELEETPKSYSSLFCKSYTKVIGNNLISLEAVKRQAENEGFHTVILTDKMSGDTAEESEKFVQFLMQYEGQKPACILMGGETTLHVTGKGKGGRNQHFVLSAINELLKIKSQKHKNKIILLSAGTDGTDGPTDAAGAIVSSHQLYSEETEVKDVLRFLEEFDSYNYFFRYGGLITTGATQTNVMDIVIGIIY